MEHIVTFYIRFILLQIVKTEIAHVCPSGAL